MMVWFLWKVPPIVLTAGNNSYVYLNFAKHHWLQAAQFTPLSSVAPHKGPEFPAISHFLSFLMWPLFFASRKTNSFVLNWVRHSLKIMLVNLLVVQACPWGYVSHSNPALGLNAPTESLSPPTKLSNSSICEGYKSKNINPFFGSINWTTPQKHQQRPFIDSSQWILFKMKPMILY